MYRDEVDVSERIQLMLCVHVYKCLHGIAPRNNGQSQRSTARGLLDVPHAKTSTYGRRAYSFANPSAWNSLSKYLKDSSFALVMLKRSLKTLCFSKY